MSLLRQRWLLPVLLLGLCCGDTHAQTDVRPEQKLETRRREVELRKTAEDVRATDRTKATSLNRPESLNRPDSLNRPETQKELEAIRERHKKAGVEFKETSQPAKPDAGTTKPDDGSGPGRGRTPGKTK